MSEISDLRERPGEPGSAAGSVDRFAVESDRRVVGVAVRVPGGFRFYSSDPDFLPLEARTFRRVRSITRRVSEISRARRRGSWRPSAVLLQ